jgi:hypothetical protein
MQNQNKILVQELQFIRTTDLLVKKASCIRWISVMKTVKGGSMAFVALLLANFFKGIFDGDTLNLSMFLSLMFALYSIVFTLVIDFVLSKSMARKEIINDILAMRNARVQLQAPKTNLPKLENESDKN